MCWKKRSQDEKIEVISSLRVLNDINIRYNNQRKSISSRGWGGTKSHGMYAEV